MYNTTYHISQAPNECLLEGTGFYLTLSVFCSQIELVWIFSRRIFVSVGACPFHVQTGNTCHERSLTTIQPIEELPLKKKSRIIVFSYLLVDSVRYREYWQPYLHLISVGSFSLGVVQYPYMHLLFLCSVFTQICIFFMPHQFPSQTR